jgi:hypothetical protein
VEAEPRITQLGEVENRVLEAAKCTPGCDRPLEKKTSARISNTFDERLHLLVSLLRWDRVDRMQPSRLGIPLAMLLEVLAPEKDLARFRVDPPAVVVRVILERLREVGEINSPQIEHAIIPLSRSIPGAIPGSVKIYGQGRNALVGLRRRAVVVSRADQPTVSGSVVRLP